MLILYLPILIDCAITNDLIWFFYYLSFWGMLISFFSIVSSIKAAKYPEWQSTAMISSECSACLNLFITPFFWIVLAPNIFKNMGWSGYDLYMRVHMTVIHTLPLVSTLINVLLTDMILLKKDWKLMIVLGIMYVFANFLGVYDSGMPLYPVLDWNNVFHTLFCFICIITIKTSLYYLIAMMIEKFKRNS